MVAVTHPISRSTSRSATGPLPRRSGEPSAAVYRRRRLVAVALLLLVAVALGNLGLQLSGRDAGPTAGAEPVVEVSVVVEPGDTVWSIAEALAGGGDVRPVVDALVEANGGAALRTGDRLVLVVP